MAENELGRSRALANGAIRMRTQMRARAPVTVKYWYILPALKPHKFTFIVDERIVAPRHITKDHHIVVHSDHTLSSPVVR
jgi:hypothetical protein